MNNTGFRNKSTLLNETGNIELFRVTEETRQKGIGFISISA